MKKPCIPLRTALSVLLLALVMALPAFAETSSITYEGDVNDGQFTFAPGTTYSPTDMFLAMKNMMPGDVRTQRIRVSNQAQGHVQLVLYVRSTWNSSGGSQALKDVISVTYTADGNAAQFEAADHAPELPDGWVLVGELNTTNGQATDVSNGWTYLGTLHTGGTVDVDATVAMDIHADNRYQNLEGRLDFLIQVAAQPDTWYSQTAGTETGQTGPGRLPGALSGLLPQTGDDGQPWLWAALMAAAACGMGLLWLYRCKKLRKSETRDDPKRTKTE